MFQLLKYLAQVLAPGFSIGNLDKKRRREVATEIFIIYSSLNEILVVGKMIATELERAISWLDEKREAGRIGEKYRTHLEFLLPQQGNNILRFQASLKRLALELQVVAPEVYSNIAPLMHGKGNALNSLVESLVGNYGQGLALPIADVRQLQQRIAAGHPEMTQQPLGRPRYLHFQSELAQHVTRADLPSLSSVGQDAAPIIRSYIEQENPRERLEEIERILHDLRGEIEKQFSMQDILVSVGDRRIANYDPWVGS